MNDLVVTQNAAPAQVFAVTNELWSGYEGGGPGNQTLARLPTPTERNALTNRSRDINAALRPISLASEEMLNVSAEISKMLGNGWPNFKPEDPLSVVNEFVEVVKGLPAYAIREAIDDFRHGRIKSYSLGDGKFAKVDPQFPPSAPMFFQIAEAKTAPLLVEQNRIKVILSVTKSRVDWTAPRSEAEQAAVNNQVEALRNEQSQRRAEEELKDRKQRKQDARDARARSTDEITREYKSLGISPVYGPANLIISPSLARTLGHNLTPQGPYRKNE